MERRDLVRGLAVGRIAIGAALGAAPVRAGERWLGADAKRAPLRLVVRSLGVRDAALGAGALVALRRGESVRPWLVGGALADVADAFGSAAAGDKIPAGGRRLTVPLAAGAAVVGMALARAES